MSVVGRMHTTRKRGRPPHDRTAFDADVALMEAGSIDRIPFCSICRSSAHFRVGVTIGGRWQGKSYTSLEDAQIASMALQRTHPLQMRACSLRGFGSKRAGKPKARARSGPTVAERKEEHRRYVEKNVHLPRGVSWNGKVFMAYICRDS